MQMDVLSLLCILLFSLRESNVQLSLASTRRTNDDVRFNLFVHCSGVEVNMFAVGPDIEQRKVRRVLNWSETKSKHQTRWTLPRT